MIMTEQFHMAPQRHLWVQLDWQACSGVNKSAVLGMCTGTASTSMSGADLGMLGSSLPLLC